MKQSNNIPQAVIDIMGTMFPISSLGTRDDIEYFRNVFPDDIEVGFPTVVACKNNDVVAIYSEFEALRIISSFIK